MHGDRLSGTGAHVGIIIGCTVVVVCAEQRVAVATRTATTPSMRPAILDSSWWNGLDWIDSDDLRKQAGFIRETVGKKLGNGGRVDEPVYLTAACGFLEARR